jgi:hypothetical protein
MLPLVPLMVSVYVPVGVRLPVDTVSVEVPEPAIELGLKLLLERAGRPETLNVTVPEKPLDGVTVAVYVVPVPRVTVRLAGDAEMLKVAPALTVWFRRFEVLPL